MTKSLPVSPGREYIANTIETALEHLQTGSWIACLIPVNTDPIYIGFGELQLMSQQCGLKVEQTGEGLVFTKIEGRPHNKANFKFTLEHYFSQVPHLEVTFS